MSDNQAPTGEDVPIVVLNSDGSYTRLISFPTSPPTPDKDSDSPVLSKDVPVNPINNTGVRIYIPKETLISTKPPAKKLPLIVYVHGGGFIQMSAATTIKHDFCNKLAEDLTAMVVSVDYRLAPEHRLPAAYDDVVEALHWIKSTQDPWLADFADFSNCYLMGTSAGANIAYHVGLRVALQHQEFEPLKIKGLILHHLYLGGVERTESEIRLADVGPMLTLSICDLCWALSLPVNEGRDHWYSNLMVGVGPAEVGRIRDMGWPVLVACRYGDLLIDRQMEFAKFLEKKGVQTECLFGEGYHGMDLEDKSKAKELLEAISSFMS